MAGGGRTVSVAHLYEEWGAPTGYRRRMEVNSGNNSYWEVAIDPLKRVMLLSIPAPCRQRWQGRTRSLLAVLFHVVEWERGAVCRTRFTGRWPCCSECNAPTKGFYA